MSTNPDREPELRDENRWVEAIANDIAGAARLVLGAILAVVEGAPGWPARIALWFKFVHLRRPDKNFGILPGWRRWLTALAAGPAAILMAVLFVDPIYMAWLRSSGGLDARYRSIFETITRFGQSDWILIGTGIIIVGISLLSARRFKGAQKPVVQTPLLNAYYLFTTVAFAGLLTNLLKNFVGRARPPFTPIGDVWFAAPFRDNYEYAAFPSGHATTAGALAIALALLFPAFRWYFLFAGAWIAISRPALGVHFPSDVLAGFLFGAAFSYVYARSFARKRLLFAFSPEGRLALRVPASRAALRRRAGGIFQAALARNLDRPNRPDKE